MLHPSQFQANEAWIVFRLNDVPIRTERDGDFHCLALMDAASTLILGMTLFPAGEDGPSDKDVRRLLRDGHARQREWPVTLFVPAGLSTNVPAPGTGQRGMDVVRVPEDQLLPVIGEARASYRERFNRSDADDRSAQ